MTFEEEFPSLKGFPMYFLRKDMSETIDGSMFDCGGIPAKEVQEHCLDKQKVNDVIRTAWGRGELSDYAANALLKRLGVLFG